MFAYGSVKHLFFNSVQNWCYMNKINSFKIWYHVGTLILYIQFLISLHLVKSETFYFTLLALNISLILREVIRSLKKTLFCHSLFFLWDLREICTTTSRLTSFLSDAFMLSALPAITARRAGKGLCCCRRLTEKKSSGLKGMGLPLTAQQPLL